MRKPRLSKTALKKPSAAKAALLVLLFIALVSAFIVYRNLQGPAKGTISTEGSPTNSAPAPSYIELGGKAIVFNYPEDYKLDPEGKPQPNVSEYYTLKKSSGLGSINVVITVYELPSGNPDDNSGFRLRNNNPGTYSQRLSTINGNPVTFFKKKDRSETVAFIPHGNKLAALALSGSRSASSEAETEYGGILNSWQWK